MKNKTSTDITYFLRGDIYIYIYSTEDNNTNIDHWFLKSFHKYMLCDFY